MGEWEVGIVKYDFTEDLELKLNLEELIGRRKGFWVGESYLCKATKMGLCYSG